LSDADENVLLPKNTRKIALKKKRIENVLKEDKQDMVVCRFCRNRYTKRGIKNHINHCPENPEVKARKCLETPETNEVFVLRLSEEMFRKFITNNRAHPVFAGIYNRFYKPRKTGSYRAHDNNLREDLFRVFKYFFPIFLAKYEERTVLPPDELLDELNLEGIPLPVGFLPEPPGKDGEVEHGVMLGQRIDERSPPNRPVAAPGGDG